MRTAVDLFCGEAGGWALGLAWAGVRVIHACEKDEARARAYGARWKVPVHRDVSTFTGDLVGHRPWLLAGSPPCKGISEVNQKGKGVDDDGLFFEAIRVADELRPPWVALENVSALRTRGADRVLDGLEGIGYAPRPFVVGSANAGADHLRPRVLIVAANTQGGKRRPARQPWAPALDPLTERFIDAGPVGRGEGLLHVGPETLGRAVRAYDGFSDADAERARHALGDSLDPLFPFLIAKALIAWESGDVRGLSAEASAKAEATA